MDDINNSFLTIERVLPLYFKMAQELEDSRKINKRLTDGVDRLLTENEQKSNVWYSLTGKISDICWEYNSGGISDKIALSEFLELEEVVNAI